MYNRTTYVFDLFLLRFEVSNFLGTLVNEQLYIQYPEKVVLWLLCTGQCSLVQPMMCDRVALRRFLHHPPQRHATSMHTRTKHVVLCTVCTVCMQQNSMCHFQDRSSRFQYPPRGYINNVVVLVTFCIMLYTILYRQDDRNQPPQQQRWCSTDRAPHDHSTDILLFNPSEAWIGL